MKNEVKEEFFFQHILSKYSFKPWIMHNKTS